MTSYMELLPTDVIKYVILPNLSQRNIINALKAFPFIDINPSYYNNDKLTLKMAVELDATYQLDQFIRVLENRSAAEFTRYIYRLLKISCKVNNILMFKEYLNRYNSNEWVDWIPIIIENNNTEILKELLQKYKEDIHNKKIYKCLDKIKWNDYEDIIYFFYKNIPYDEELFLLVLEKGSMKMINDIYNLWKGEVDDNMLIRAFDKFCDRGWMYRRTYKDYSQIVYFIIENMTGDYSSINFEKALHEIIHTYPIELGGQYIFNQEIGKCFVDTVHKIRNMGNNINWNTILCGVCANSYEEIIEKFLFVYNEAVKDNYVFSSEKDYDIRVCILDTISYSYDDEELDIRINKLQQTKYLLDSLNL